MPDYQYVTYGTPDGAIVGASSGKIGFFGATPVVKQGSTTDIKDAMVTYGLVTDSGASPLNLDGGAFGAGTTTVTSSSASALTVGANGATNPVVKVDASTSSVATGISVTGAAAAGGVAVAAISSGTNENLSINAKGSGIVKIASSSTGGIQVGTNATDIVAIKGIYMSPSNVAVTIPSFAQDTCDSVAVDVSGAFSIQPAVGDAVIAIPQEALVTNCVLSGCYITNTDTITVAFQSSEAGAVTGAAKNFKFLIIDLT